MPITCELKTSNIEYIQETNVQHFNTQQSISYSSAKSPSIEQFTIQRWDINNHKTGNF